MKKLFSILICLEMLLLPAFCELKDEFVENSLDKNLKIKKIQQKSFEDELVNSNLNQNLKIKTKQINLFEEYFDKDFFNRASSRKIVKVKNLNFEDLNPKNEKIVKVSIKKYLTTKNCPDEGQYIDFQTLEDVEINNVLYKKGSTIQARIGTISKNHSMGVPSELIIDKFFLNDISLIGKIDKTGANRSIWVYPCSCVGMMFFGLGVIFIPLRGGHAKIKPKEVFELMYVSD